MDIITIYGQASDGARARYRGTLISMPPLSIYGNNCLITSILLHEAHRSRCRELQSELESLWGEKEALLEQCSALQREKESKEQTLQHQVQAMQADLELKAAGALDSERKEHLRLEMERDKAAHALLEERARVERELECLQEELETEKLEVRTGAERELTLLQELERCEAELGGERESQFQLKLRMEALQHVVWSPFITPIHAISTPINAISTPINAIPMPINAIPTLLRWSESRGSIPLRASAKPRRINS